MVVAQDNSPSSHYVSLVTINNLATGTRQSDVSWCIESHRAASRSIGRLGTSRSVYSARCPKGRPEIESNVKPPRRRNSDFETWKELTLGGQEMELVNETSERRLDKVDLASIKRKGHSIALDHRWTLY